MKESFVERVDETTDSTYHKLGCQHEHNYSAVVVKGDVTGIHHYDYDIPISIEGHIYGLTYNIIKWTGCLFSIVYLKETECTYIVYKSFINDNDLHSKELRDKFFDDVKECIPMIERHNPNFVIVELKHYFAVIPEGCMCRHCYKIADGL